MGIGLLGAIGLVLVATQLYRPRDHPGALLVAVAIFVMTTVVLAAYGSESMLLGVMFLLSSTLALVLHPTGRAWLSLSESYRPKLVALVLVSVIPLVMFSIGHLTLETAQPRGPSTPPTSTTR